MFDFVEKNKGLVKILLALIVLGLVVGFGLSGYSALSEPYIAKVGGVKITEREFAEVTEGQTIPSEQRMQVLSQLIQRQLVLNEAEARHFGVSKVALQYVISNIPSFMENGKFSPQRYQDVLAAQHKTTQQYEKELAREIRIQHLLQPLVESRFVSKTMVQKLATLLQERREVRMATFIPQMVIAQVSVNDEEVKKYYSQNKGALQLPQQARVEYIVFSQAALAQDIQISEQELEQYQANNKSLNQEERQARHILFTVPKEAEAKAKTAIQAKAAAILKVVKADPAKFADLAREYSQDPGSAQQGGELGFFKPGVMVPAFDQIVFSLKKDEISNLVETPFGFHIIQLQAIRAPSKEEIRDSAITAIKAKKLSERFLVEQSKLSEALLMTKDLRSVAEKFHLGVQTSDWLSKAAAKETILNHEKVREAIFAEESLDKQYNTELIEIQPGVMLAARVIEKKPPVQQSLEQVRESIMAKLKEEKALQRAKEVGRKALAELKAGRIVQLAWSGAQNIDRLTPSPQGAIVRDLFRPPASALPAYVGADTPYGYVVYCISQIVPPSSEDKAGQKNIEKSLVQFYGQLEANAYLQSLQKKTTLDISPPAAAQ